MSEVEDEGPEQSRNPLAIQVGTGSLFFTLLLISITLSLPPLGKIPQVVQAEEGRRQLQ